MTLVLKWKNNIEKRHIAFYCIDNNEIIPPSKWLLNDIFTEDFRKCSSEKLYLLLQEEKAYINAEKHICVNYDEIANFSKKDLTLLGMPEPVPYRLMIECYGSPVQKNFKIKFRFLDPNSKPIIGLKISGIIAYVGTKKYCLINPIYSILLVIEQINKELNIDKRLLLISNLNSLTAQCDEVNRLEKFLRSLTICEALKFTIRPFYNTNNEPDFDIILLDGNDREILPKKYLDYFNHQFIYFNKVKTKYSLGNNWYLVLSEELQKVLGLVKSIKQSDPKTRLQFIMNPYSFLSQLDEDLGLDISNYFSELNYSERVKSIGLWMPRFISFLKKREGSLSKEALGIYLNDRIFELGKEEIALLIEKVKRAISENRLVVEHKGLRFPASEDFLAYLKTVCEDKLSESPSPEIQAEGINRDRELKTLQIRSNVEDIEFLIKRKSRAGEFGIPDGIKLDLLPHQREGLYWLQRHWIEGSPGCILADDMGLGKTVQALAFLKWVKELMTKSLIKTAPFLIVAPTGLLKNWKEEIYKFLKTPGLGHILEVYGKNLKMLKVSSQDELYIDAPVLDIVQIRNYDVVLVSYETLRNYQKSFGLIKWCVIIFDEAQKIKNPGTMITDACKAMNFEFSIALTGTPVENRLSDLWSIVDTVSPGLLKTLKEFIDYYEKENRLEELKKFLMEDIKPPVLLRRTKQNILKGLPKKKTFLLQEKMPSFQARIYDHIILQNCYSDDHILEIIHQLKFVSLHPCIIETCSEDLINDPKNFLKYSARTCKLLEILDNIRDHEEKVLIFVEYRDFQARLANLINKIYSIKPYIINGSVPGPKRLVYAKEFSRKKGFYVMILSPRAAGMGLNLTAANHVIHLTRWWNPAIEDQCTDRVYRIGQRKTVYVYLPLAIHPQKANSSFDYKLHELIKEKRKLATNLLAPPDVTKDELLKYFRPILNTS